MACVKLAVLGMVYTKWACVVQCTCISMYMYKDIGLSWPITLGIVVH